MLVAAGAEIDQADGTSGRTPLHHAVEADNVAIAGHLLLEVRISQIQKKKKQTKNKTPPSSVRMLQMRLSQAVAKQLSAFS